MMHILQLLNYIVLFVLTILTLSPNANAASFQSVTTGECKLLIEGEIVRGDLNNLTLVVERNKLIGNQDSTSGDSDAILCLNSNGGSFVEGVAIAKFISEKGIGTVVRNGERCLSVCAIMFMAGLTSGEENNKINRKLHYHGTLGFHRPFLEFPDREGDLYDLNTIQVALDLALDATAQLMNLGNGLVEFGNNQRMRSTLIEEMMKHKGNDLFFIDTVDRAGRWGIEIYGYKPLSSISKREIYNACNNFLSWSNGESNTDDYDALYGDGSFDPVSTSISVEDEALRDAGYESSFQVNMSGLVDMGCSVFANSRNKSDLSVRICAINNWLDKTYGDCENKFNLNPLQLSNFYLFTPSTKIADINRGSAISTIKKAMKFRESTNADLTGSDLRGFENLSTSECRVSCENYGSCEGVTYDRWNQRCYLKTRVSSIILSAKSDVWLREDVKANRLPGKPSMLKRKGKAFPDTPYRNSGKGDFEACAAACLADAKCMAVNFRHAGRCEFFDRPSEYQTDAATDIAFKMQSP